MEISVESVLSQVLFRALGVGTLSRPAKQCLKGDSGDARKYTFSTQYYPLDTNYICFWQIFLNSILFTFE